MERSKQYVPHQSVRYLNPENKGDSGKPLPMLYENRENCCGCTACKAACPVNAIVMADDSEGFPYPVIDAKKCLRCGKCLAVCRLKEDQREKGYLKDAPPKTTGAASKEPPACYAVKHKNFEIRMASRSGGIFTAVSDWILEQGGVVYGCVQTKDFLAQHIRAERKEDRDRMRGSKYIQSSLDGIFQQVRSDLDAGRKVLFSGTSCQVAGLKSYLRTDYENLLTVDIVCHGVPSPLIWKEYLVWQSKKHKAVCKAVDFRNKRDFGWKAHVETLTLQNVRGEMIQVNSEVYKRMFNGVYLSRPSCYQCPYKSVFHPADLTIADYWGIQKIAPEFNDNKGVSLVLVNTDAGKALFEQVKDTVELLECKLEDSLQSALKAPFPVPADRTEFWKMFYSEPFEALAKKYGGYGFVNTAKRKLGRMKRSLKAKLRR